MLVYPLSWWAPCCWSFLVGSMLLIFSVVCVVFCLSSSCVLCCLSSSCVFCAHCYLANNCLSSSCDLCAHCNLANSCLSSSCVLWSHYYLANSYRSQDEYVSFVVITISRFPHSLHITWILTRVTRRVPPVEQELLTHPQHLSLPLVFVEFVLLLNKKRHFVLNKRTHQTVKLDLSF